MQTPNFYIIGAPKSGTSALAQYLATHPQVFFASPKELFFWAEDHPIARTRFGLNSVAQYLRFFEGSDPRIHLATGEGSTNYLQSRTAVKNILDFNPDSKFIVLLRDPVEVAYGMHGELRRHYFEDVEDFEKAWKLQEDRRSGKGIPKGCLMVNQLQYRDVVDFSSQIERLFHFVPPTQRLVMFFQDFSQNPGEIYRRCLEFLGLPNDGRESFPRVNESRQDRVKLLGKLYQNPPGFIEPLMKQVRIAYSSMPESVKNSVIRLLSHKKPRTRLDASFEYQLRSELAPMVCKLEVLLDRDLQVWKPD